MDKVNFVITDILVNKSSMGGYSLDIFLKDGPQLKTRFEDDKLFVAAKQPNVNLFHLKYLFAEQYSTLISLDHN